MEKLKNTVVKRLYLKEGASYRTCYISRTLLSNEEILIKEIQFECDENKRDKCKSCNIKATILYIYNSPHNYDMYRRPVCEVIGDLIM